MEGFPKELGSIGNITGQQTNVYIFGCVIIPRPL